MKVCIDPGHGGYDPGAVGPTGLREKDVTLAIALKIGKLLQSAVVEVAYTRTSDAVSWPANINQDLAARTQIANRSGADIFISVHCNSSKNASAHGMEIFTTSGQGLADRLAENIVNAWTEQFPLMTIRKDLTDGDSDKEANFYVLRNTAMPAVLIETAFISNAAEEELLSTPAFQAEAAKAIADGVLDYFGIKKEVKTVDNTVSEWANTAWEWAVSKGLIADNNPKQTITKEQVVLILYKAFGGK
ncbi:N-acetylmuramoyl-L-alanine amidase family protein [Syntrophomonas wolfei]|uniref:N-acetylmuramoyl-L-alanine amidase family protein n=1 Tax=Syntrophomonas wolfei TaxID=863 RepID=UPI0023F0C862|nr:N-acetylmuramoyl-L-alanine amidase [Syntrophomonas wolfei]